MTDYFERFSCRSGLPAQRSGPGARRRLRDNLRLRRAFPDLASNSRVLKQQNAGGLRSTRRSRVGRRHILKIAAMLGWPRISTNAAWHLRSCCSARRTGGFRGGRWRARRAHCGRYRPNGALPTSRYPSVQIGLGRTGMPPRTDDTCRYRTGGRSRPSVAATFPPSPGPKKLTRAPGRGGV
jgi:hypothetical protein